MTGRIFYWNKTTYDQAGIETPDLSRLKSSRKVFQEKLGDEYYPLAMNEYDRTIFMVYYLESKYGKAWVENNELQYSEDEIKDGLEFIQSLEADHVIPSIATIAGDGAASFDKNPKWMEEANTRGIFEWDSAATKQQGRVK